MDALRRVRFNERGGTDAAKLAALCDFAKSLSLSPLLEQTLVAGVLPAGATDVLVSHPLARAPVVAIVGSVSTTGTLTAMDAQGTRAFGGDPAREVRVHAASADVVDTSFVVLIG